MTQNNIVFSIDKNKIATLSFNLQDRPINVLNSQTMLQLNQFLNEIKSNSEILGLVFKSTKKDIFIAGADIHEINNLKSKEEAQEKLAFGHQIMTKIEQLSIPTIAAVKGACLGGGLELALACDEIVCSNDSKTILGQPEINLGIIPGFGGTIRLPKKIGLQKAMNLILTGKPVNAKQAQKMGLVAKTFRDCFFEEHSYEWIKSFIKKGKPKKKHGKKYIFDKSPLARKVLFVLTKKMLIKKTKGQYPAPEIAVNVIKKNFNKKLGKATNIEINGFLNLVNTPISNNLINLFLNSENIKKNNSTTKQAKPKNVMVIGSGLMGSGIAWLFSYQMYHTFIKDINFQNVLKGLSSIKNIYFKLKKRKRWSNAEVKQFMNKIQVSTDNVGYEKIDFFLEAVTENKDLKEKIFNEIEEKNTYAVIATNTSSLSVNEMSKKLKYPERFIGMHFFSPANKMPLVEIIPGKQTSNNTLHAVQEMCKSLKKVGIVVKDCPGFLINRILIPYVNEAILCLEDGASIEEIDSLMETFGMPIGPLALADEVGLDVGHKVACILEEGYGQRMKVSKLFKYIIESTKYLGKKNKRGFYVYPKNKSVNTEIIKLAKTKHLYCTKKDIHKDCLDRLILIMVNEASRCLEEKVVQSQHELDLAMIMGTGFPPFRGGLCKYADQQGIENIINRLDILKNKYGNRFTPANLLLEMQRLNKSFY